MLGDTSTRTPGLPSRSNSTRVGGPPHDASKSDDSAIADVYDQVSATGSLELAAKKLQQYAAQRRWEDDPEEAGYMAQHQGGYGVEDDDDMYDRQGVVEGQGQGQEDGEEEVVHLQEVVEGLWIGDLVSAMDTEGLEQRGITNVLSLLVPALKFPPNFAHYPLEIDDAPDTDIFTHLPSCVAWISSALTKREHPNQEFERDRVIDPKAQDTKPGGVLVHCQAGMSRSATVVCAYLMRSLGVEPVDALEMLREKRPVVDPSDTFWYQLALFYNADGKVSLKDRQTRQFYMERTTSHFMNGDGGAPPLDKMAKFPATPTPSNPPTPMGGHGRRKIRCKMCRRHLAVREHMMDHILDQSPVSRPRTPSNFALPSPRMSFTHPAGERRPSVVSDVVNPLTGLPGATRSRHASVSSGVASPAPMTSIHDGSGSGSSKGSSGEGSKNRARSQSGPLSPGVPLPRTSTPGLTITTGSFENGLSSKLSADPINTNNLGGSITGIGTVPSPLTLSRQPSQTPSPVAAKASPDARQFRSAEELASRLPPHLQALRMAGGGQGTNGLSSPFGTSPSSSPERESTPMMPMHEFPPRQPQPGSSGSTGSGGGGGASVGRRKSLLQMTPAENGSGGVQRRGSERRGTSVGGLAAGGGFASMQAEKEAGSIVASSGPPILVNPKCSGYFVEPLTWMEPVLKKGDISGKLVCPNEKCGVKIGNFDWAGVQCGCKEWVTPGFCISRSKVDEVW